MTQHGPGAEAPQPERARMLEYLRARGAALAPAEIHARFRAAVREFEAALDGVTEAEARRSVVAGEWTIAQVVDHLAQTTIRSADALRHHLAGRRPPAPPVYEGLISAAAAWASWDELLEGLRSANGELDALLGAAKVADGTPPTPTIRTILVAQRTSPTGQAASEAFAAELGWKEYALVQRLHLLDHRNQVRALRAALRLV